MWRVATTIVRQCTSSRMAAASSASRASAPAPPLPLPLPHATSLDSDRLIVIAGGGIGGSALALALQQRGMPCVVFERDATAATRAQGYGLTMQQGRHALHQLGLDSLQGINSQAHLSFDHHGGLLGCYGQAMRAQAEPHPSSSSSAASSSMAADQANGGVDANADDQPAQLDDHAASSPSCLRTQKRRPPHHNIHLPRQRLRSALLDQLRPGTVRWGVSVERYTEDVLPSPSLDGHSVDSVASASSSAAAALPEPSAACSSLATVPSLPSPGLRVHLSDGSSLRCALLVGCDGLRSGIRSAKIGDPLNYLGVIVILGFAHVRHPLAHRRVVQTCDGHTRMYFMPFEPRKAIADGENAPGLNSSALQPSSSSTTSSSPTCSKRDVGPPAEDEPDAKKIKSSDQGQLPLEGEVAMASSSPDVAAAVSDGAPDDDCITMWQLSFPVSESDSLLLQSSGGAGLKAEALRRCAHWHAPIPELIRATRVEDITGYPAYDRDIPSLVALRYGAAAATAAVPPTAALAMPSEMSDDSLTLSHDRGVHSLVTLIGDSAHPMSPFKGQGANQALLDAVSLASSLHESVLGVGSSVAVHRSKADRRQRGPRIRPTVVAALARFEGEMIARASPKVTESRHNVAFLHSPAVLTQGNHTRAFVAKAAARQEPKLVHL